VGHYNGGFLNPEYDHPLELAVDTYLYKNTSDFVLQEFNDDGVNFVVAGKRCDHTLYNCFEQEHSLTTLEPSATAYAANQMSGFSALNASAVQDVSHFL